MTKTKENSEKEETIVIHKAKKKVTKIPRAKLFIDGKEVTEITSIEISEN